MLKRSWMTTFVVALSSFTFTACNNHSTTQPQAGHELIVLMDESLPGYFVLGNESYGYQYDLMKAYADYRGLELRVISGNKASLNAQMLERGEADIFTTLTDHLSPTERAGSVPICKTSYVLLGTRAKAAQLGKSKKFELIPFLRGNKLLLSSGFRGSKAYGTLLDSLSGNDVYISERNSFGLMEALRSGEYDLLICEMSEAQLGCALVPQVEQIYTFSETVSLSAVVTPQNPKLRADFQAWLLQFRTTPQYALLNELYFEKGIVGQLIGEGLKKGYLPGRISAYDEIFKRICEEEGYDWRFISAIAFHESRFNPQVVSQRGAQGLMQVMPRVARQLGHTGNLKDPASNILMGLKVLGKIEKSLNLGEQTAPSDRMKIVLACYNAGVGHVLDARRLAAKYGANPDSWEEISYYLVLKSDPQILADEAVRCGMFNSRQTLAFVDGVVSRYLNYCNRVGR